MTQAARSNLVDAASAVVVAGAHAAGKLAPSARASRSSCGTTARTSGSPTWVTLPRLVRGGTLGDHRFLASCRVSGCSGPAFAHEQVSCDGRSIRLLSTNNRSATRPDRLHPVHRHDVGRTRAPDRTALDDRRYRNEADPIARATPQQLSQLAHCDGACAGSPQRPTSATRTPPGGTQAVRDCVVLGDHDRVPGLCGRAIAGDERVVVAVADEAQ
jgi:hypothetical protein